jgi:ParB family chromosome partitioning protein
MELKTVDPRSLIENPDNPRRRAPPDQADGQMAATARAVGILQPPVVREMPGGLMTIYGHRRVRGAIAADLPEIRVLVLGAEEHADDDAMRALIENTTRKAMSPVEQWRAIEKLVSERWTEEAISGALVLPVRTLRKLRLLARIHPPMLDRMHAGDMPNESDLRTIASASPEEQASVWKKNKPKKGEEVSWWQLARALTRRTMRAADAVFDAEFAAAYGVEYVEDLFAQADQDSRTTTNVDGFLAAQHAWMEANLPPDGVVLQAGEYGGAKLPRGANRHYGRPGAGGAKEGYFLDERTGRVETILFTVPASAPTTGSGREGSADGTTDLPKAPRPALTQKGAAMVGNMCTDALHAALREEPIDEQTLIALLVLALAGHNVEVKTGLAHVAGLRDTRREIAARLTEGGAVTSDPALLQEAARSMLAYTLSCRDNWSQSGPVARIAGDAIGADAHLPNMATADFLACLSKAAVEGVAVGLNVLVQPTGKATRGDVIARVGEGRWIYPPALFAAADTMAVPARPGEVAETRSVCRWDDVLDHDGTGEALPKDGIGKDHTGEDAGSTADETDLETPPDEHDDDAPKADEPPAVPVRRRRSRKDNDEARAAA